MYKEIETIIQNQMKEYLTPENLQYLIEQEYKTYCDEEYKPLYSDNLIIQQAIKYIREKFTSQFEEIYNQLNKAINIACDDLQLTGETREEAYKIAWNMFKIIPSVENGKFKINIETKE